MAFERRLHDSTLHPGAAAVDEPHFANARRVRRVDILLHHRTDVARGERVKIERVLDRHVMGLVVEIRHSCYTSVAALPLAPTGGFS